MTNGFYDTVTRHLAFEVDVLKRIRTLIVRSTIAALLAWLLATAPLPSIAPQMWFAYIQVPIVVLVLICYIGKLIIDTFFYNHYQP